MTWKTLLLLAAAAGLVVAAVTLTTQAGPAAGGGVFAGLRKGQPVRLIDAGDVFAIETYGGSRSGNQTVAEVGPDYLAVSDSHNNVTRIPVTSIKSVTIRY
jgi:hypothetical protein